MAADREDRAYPTNGDTVVTEVTAASFSDLIPKRPFCCDDPRDGVMIRSRKRALRYQHVQFNGPGSYGWLMFDIDAQDACYAPQDALLPDPNIISVNPKNGHAHVSYRLCAPVASHDAARQAPLRFYAAVERGLARRLGADRAYAGVIAKNPLHAHWRTEFRIASPYELSELASFLHKGNMRPDPPVVRELGAGRNVALFDTLRNLGYSKVLSFKKDGSREGYAAFLLNAAEQTNLTFHSPLPKSEIRAVVKSVAKWTWTKFSEAELSRIQSARRTIVVVRNDKRLEQALGNYAIATTDDIANVLNRGQRTARRYKARAKKQQGISTLSKSRPWQVEGVSRATWYRNNKSKKE